MREELLQTAEEHVDSLDFVLGGFGRSRDNFAAIIGDNANTNRALVRKLGILFIGCYSHKFDLSIKKISLERDKVLKKRNVLVGKLSYLIPAALLRQKPFCLPDVATPSDDAQSLERCNDTVTFDTNYRTLLIPRCKI